MRAFVQSLQVLTWLQENAFRYDALASGRVEGGVNTYTYVTNNPISRIDPTGELGFLVIPGVCAAGGCEAIAAALGLGAYLSTPTGQKAAKDAADAISDAVNCKDDNDDPCDKVLDKSLLRRAGISGREHAVKTDALGTNKSLSMFDLCGCKDGRVVVKAHGCKGPIISETEYRWK